MEDGEWVLVRAPPQKDWWNPTLSNVNDEPSRPLKVTFSGPATHWTDAIPIGNGRLGAMIWGGVSSELLQLNGKSNVKLYDYLFGGSNYIWINATNNRNILIYIPNF